MKTNRRLISVPKNSNVSKKPEKRKSNNYLIAFCEAECFLNVSNIIKEKTCLKTFSQQEVDQSINFQYAARVNHSYAFELYLKCLMIIETGEYYRCHDLLFLFNELPLTTRTNIEERFNNDVIFFRRNMTYFGLFVNPSLHDLLKEASTAFMDFRYLFEKTSNTLYDLAPVIECIRHEIFQKKPELKQVW